MLNVRRTLAIFLLSISGTPLAYGKTVFFTEARLPGAASPTSWIQTRDGVIVTIGQGDPGAALAAVPALEEPVVVPLHAQEVMAGRIRVGTQIFGNARQIETAAPDELVRRLLVAQSTLLAQGITAVQDNTLEALPMAQLARLEERGLLKIRIWARSQGGNHRVRSRMMSLEGPLRRHLPERRALYFGEYYGNAQRLTDAEIEEIFLFAGPYNVVFEIDPLDLLDGQKIPDVRPSILRIAGIRDKVKHRRPAGTVDLIEIGNPLAFSRLSEDEKARVAASGLLLSTGSDYDAQAALLGREAPERFGELKAGRNADFVTRDRNGRVTEVYIHGEKVFPETHGPEAPGKDDSRIPEELRTRPYALTFAPLVGYDATLGLILGGAAFRYTYEDVGPALNSRVALAPLSGRGYGELEMMNSRGPDKFSPKINLRINTLPANYYGYGNGTASTRLGVTQPVRFDVAPALIYRLPGIPASLGMMDIQLTTTLSYFKDFNSDLINGLSSAVDLPLEGFYGVTRLEFLWDHRDNPYSTRFGGRRLLWTESWWSQAGAGYAQRAGFGLSQFFPLLAPDWILGLRLDGATLFGNRTYINTLTLGGPLVLRGYYGNRYRGEAAVSSALELRYPIWRIISGVVFTEIGRVWASQDPTGSAALHPTFGFGLRGGLPPDGLIKARLDYGIGLDQSTFTLTFNEAF